MGNGSGVEDEDSFLPPSASPLSQDVIEQAAASIASSFGQAQQVFMSTHALRSFFSMTGMTLSLNPEFVDTPYENRVVERKLLRSFASFHVMLIKLKILKSDIDHEEIAKMAIDDGRLDKLKAKYRKKSKKLRSKPKNPIKYNPSTKGKYGKKHIVDNHSSAMGQSRKVLSSRNRRRSR